MSDSPTFTHDIGLVKVPRGSKLMDVNPIRGVIAVALDVGIIIMDCGAQDPVVPRVRVTDVTGYARGSVPPATCNQCVDVITGLLRYDGGYMMVWNTLQHVQRAVY